MNIDFAAINAAALPCLESLVREWLPEGHRESGEYKIGSLSGEPGRSCSINLRSGVWKDFASDAGGSDPISLLAAIRNVSQKEAAIELGERLRTGIESDGVRAAPKAKEAPEWKPITAPANAPSPSFNHHRFGTPSHKWAYRDTDGNLLGFICRFDLPNGKDVVPRCYAESSEGRREWRWLSFAKPRPLYGLDLLAANPAAGVLIVEGEKAADAARTISPGVVVTWPGGGKAVRFTDWSPLKGRKVVIWPDRDEPGIEAAQAIARAIAPIVEKVRIITPPAGESDGWDLADAVAEGWDRARLVQALKPAPEPEPDHDEPPPHDFEPVGPPPDVTENAAPFPEPVRRVYHNDRVSDLPFRLLGVDGDQFFYMPDKGQQIVSLTASSHSKLNLMRLAPLQLWEAEYPCKSGADWEAAANAMIQKSISLPKFDPRRIRGRGCWIDGDDVVFHAGDKLYIGGKEMPIQSYRSHVRAVYEGGLEIEMDAGEIANSREAGQLIELCEMLSWERPLYGKLLAGWLALAPICGSLKWRPHVWITGPSGSGKSWAISNIVGTMVGTSAVHVQGSSTEAGVRQQIGCDALPVVFDEAESEDKRGQQRLEGMLELARQASSESLAGIVKGSANGSSVTYLVRSCFMFASIGVAAVKKADVSRISTLTLRKNLAPGADDHFRLIEALASKTTQDDGYCARLRARSLRNAKAIRANALTFSAAAVAFTGDKRSADQVGALLAGAFSLTSNKEVTREYASEWMAKQDWTGFKSEDIDNDENQCLSHLFASSIRFELAGRAVTRSIAEAVQAAQLSTATDDQLRERVEVKSALQRHGIKIKDGRAYIANKHPALERLFADTPWAGAKWRQQFERVEGHQRHEVMNFGTQVRQRAVSIPI